MQIQIAVTALLFAVALSRGAAPERIMAGTLLATSLLDLACDTFLQTPLDDAGCWERLTIDAVAFGVMVTVALHANRVYPLSLGALQMVRLASHMWHLSPVRTVPAAHLILDEASIALQSLVMTVGLACHVLRVRRYGHEYPAWIA